MNLLPALVTWPDVFCAGPVCLGPCVFLYLSPLAGVRVTCFSRSRVCNCSVSRTGYWPWPCVWPVAPPPWPSGLCSALSVRSSPSFLALLVGAGTGGEDECFRGMCLPVFSFQFIMPSSKCVAVRDGRACSHEFSSDGHSLCVPHRPCVNSEFIFDPDLCSVCAENVHFLRTLGRVDRQSLHYSSLRRSWEAAQRSAKRKSRAATWKDADLREFLLGRGSRRSSLSASSSALASPASSSSGGTAAAALVPDEASLPSLPPPPPVAASASSPPWLWCSTSR